MVTYNYSNTAVQTTLSGNISGAATSITVAGTAGFPGTTPYVLAVDYGAATEELVVVTAVGGTTLTVTRGFSGTSAQSHSIGAIVRHVVNAQDLTDFRTHEAAAASVHGVTGALVGATQAQTLTNKTLTSPTINAGALSGTFTGAPVFTGGPSFTTASVLFQRAVTTNPAVRTSVTGDANDRLLVQADGTMLWGSGSATGDTNLYRSAANTLKTDDVLIVADELQPQNLVRGTRAAATDSQIETRVSGDASARWVMLADGKMTWGSGAAGGDTTLYRSAADTLKTDDALVVTGDLTVSATTWTNFTPSWTITSSPATATNIGWYKKLGKVVFFEIYTAWSAVGTGTVGVQGNLPSTPFRDGTGANTTRQVVLGQISATSTISPGIVMGQILAGGAGTAFSLLMYDNNPIQSNYIQSGTLVTLQGWYREA